MADATTPDACVGFTVTLVTVVAGAVAVVAQVKAARVTAVETLAISAIAWIPVKAEIYNAVGVTVTIPALGIVPTH